MKKQRKKGKQISLVLLEKYQKWYDELPPAQKSWHINCAIGAFIDAESSSDSLDVPYFLASVEHHEKKFVVLEAQIEALTLDNEILKRLMLQLLPEELASRFSAVFYGADNADEQS